MTAPTARTARAVIRLGQVVLDTRDPAALARFYAEILGGEVQAADSPDWVEVILPTGGALGFQLAPDHVPPTWPDRTVPQQVHLDLEVDDLDAAERLVLAAGATSTGLPAPRTEAGQRDSFRVYLDPSGHPFCLCRS